MVNTPTHARTSVEVDQLHSTGQEEVASASCNHSPVPGQPVHRVG